MSAALQIHRIVCPENTEVRDRLHTHLWKQFPMDAFRFHESEDSKAPCYEGTRMSPAVGEEDGDRTASEVFLEDVKNAVAAFVDESASVAA